MNTTYSNGAVYLSDRNQSVHIAQIYTSSLSLTERVILGVVVLIIVLIALIVNMAMLCVAIKSDKINTFFRTCLISLACSDIINSGLTALNYMAQYVATYPNFWILGSLLCQLLPFLLTTALLVNGFTLVGISFHRYLAIRKLMTNWEPNAKMCFLIAIVFWGISAGISCPTYLAYHYTEVVVRHSSGVISNKPHYSCYTLKSENAVYFTILFCFLFIPTFFAFWWFNTVLAREIWKRHKIANQMNNEYETSITSSRQSVNADQPISTKTEPNNQPRSGDCNKNLNTSTSRGNQHLKMFCVIVLLIITYLVLRLPQWLFLILSLNNVITNANAILIQYIFGILSMLSAVFNPLLYAFLTQTVQYSIHLYSAVYRFSVDICKRVGGSCAFDKKAGKETTAEPNIVDRN